MSADMSKYNGLGEYLGKQRHAEIPMTFSEIERVTRVKLPPKAQHHRAWWSNNPSNNVMTKVWLAAGYETSQVDMAGRRLVFRRATPVHAASPAQGLSEWSHTFRAKEVSPVSLFGALKGTFTIEADWDPAKPALEDELDIGRTADLIDNGLRGKS
jgi:hypothetical protein